MSYIDSKILKQISNAQNVVILTGAGISAESGVPTFRGNEGLWKNIDPIKLASQEAFSKNPELVWEWYEYRKSIINSVKPNPGHYALYELETLFNTFTLCTQNVDGLHQMAGSKNVLELHGNIHKSRCNRCYQNYDNIHYSKTTELPKCTCGALLRPNVVWFGENLPEDVIEASFKAAVSANVFIVAGTSSVVYPAAMLPQEASKNGALLIEINMTETPLTPLVDQFIPGKTGEKIPELLKSIHTFRKINA